MGNTATTTRPPTENQGISRQDILTQIGHTNTMMQHNVEILEHTSHMKTYMSGLLYAVILLGVFFMMRYFVKFLNRRIDQRAAASVMQMRRIEAPLSGVNTV